MTKAPAARSFEVRHVQLARAAFAAIAAIMVTFSPDHSSVIGLSIFSGFALATGLVLVAAGWLVFTVDTRWPTVGLGAIFGDRRPGRRDRAAAQRSRCSS